MGRRVAEAVGAGGRCLASAPTARALRTCIVSLAAATARFRFPDLFHWATPCMGQHVGVAQIAVVRYSPSTRMAGVLRSCMFSRQPIFLIVLPFRPRARPTATELGGIEDQM